jgi:putative holliday junction resolvase
MTAGPHAILGIDLGSRRIGLAIAEADGLSARPLTTLAVTTGGSRRDAIDPGPVEPQPQVVAAIERLVQQYQIGEMVVGLPLEANGTPGPMAASAMSWASALGRRLGLPVVMRDERLSSSVAEDRLGPMPRGRAGGPPSRTQRERYRARVDREAAAIILQDELDARRTTRP